MSTWLPASSRVFQQKGEQHMANLSPVVEWFSQDEAEQLLKEYGTFEDRGFMQLPPVDLLGSLDQDGVPEWFPHYHPRTGARLTALQRRQWFREVLPTDLPPPTRHSSNASRRNEQNTPQRYELLMSLWDMHSAVENGSLPTPDWS